MCDVLLVEDNAADARLVREALREASLDVRLVLARDGVEALECLRALHASVDVVLLDLNLPRMNGHDLLIALRDDPALRRVPVIVLTSSDMPRDVERCYELGARHVTAKPATLSDLVHTVRHLADMVSTWGP